MTEKRPTPDESAGKGRRKRVAPTIDLKATDVTPQAAQAADTTSPDLPPSDAQTDAPPTDAPVVTSEADPPPPPAADEPIAAADASAPNEAPQPSADEASASVPPATETESEINAAPAAAARGGLTMPMLGAGFVGAILAAAVLLTMWLSGLLPVRFAALTATRARVAALEMQVQDIQKRPVANTESDATSKQSLEALTRRVDKLEAALAKIPPGDPSLGERVAAADNAVKSLGIAVTALSKRTDDAAAGSTQARDRADAADKAIADLRTAVQDISRTANAGASSADLAPLQQRIATLEQASKTASSEIAKAAASDNAARLALSASSLRDAVLRGAPFAGELAQAKALGADDKVLASLSPYAAGGVPSDKALAAELDALLPGMIKSAGAPPASGGFIERLQANAAQLIRIRPVDAPVGDDPATVLARLEVDAAKADIAAALNDLGKLSDAQRAPAQGWIGKAKARQAAYDAARQFAAGTSRSLGTR